MAFKRQLMCWFEAACRARQAGLNPGFDTTAVTLAGCVVLASHLNAHAFICKREW